MPLHSSWSGGYLLVPPSMPLDHPQRETHAPLSRWAQVEAFDSANACETFRQQLMGRAGKVPLQPHVKRENLKTAVIDSECIATDDPRLKEN